MHMRNYALVGKNRYPAYNCTNKQDCVSMIVQSNSRLAQLNSRTGSKYHRPEYLTFTRPVVVWVWFFLIRRHFECSQETMRIGNGIGESVLPWYKFVLLFSLQQHTTNDSNSSANKRVCMSSRVHICAMNGILAVHYNLYMC